MRVIHQDLNRLLGLEFSLLQLLLNQRDSQADGIHEVFVFVDELLNFFDSDNHIHLNRL